MTKRCIGGFIASGLPWLTRGSPPYRTTPTYVRRQTSMKFMFTYLAVQLESCFLPLNPKVHFSPTQLAWYPLDIPAESTKTDFISGLKTLAGNGDPTMREGLAVHIFTANESMAKKAFVNSDGDFLILPQQGRLDIQTEFGK